MPEGSLPNAPHLLVPWPSRTLTPKAPQGGRSGRKNIVDRSGRRAEHAERLTHELTSLRQETAADTSVAPGLRADGFAVRIEAAPGHELRTDSLDKSGLSLMTVHPATETRAQTAVVWIPDGAIATLLRKIDQFAENNVPPRKPKNNALVANIEQIEQATLASLWQEEEPFPAPESATWWELWLDSTLTDHDQVSTLRSLAEAHGWRMLPRAIGIGRFHVAQINTTAGELTRILRTNACPSEIRRPSFTEDLHSRDLRELHSEFVHDLAGRLSPAAPSAPAVTLLDTGIDQEHPLLRATIIGAYSVLATEGTDDTNGHGTQMGGLALFGATLEQALGSQTDVQLDHHLESVKILGRDRTQPRPFGEVTAVAVSTAETAVPDQQRTRVFTMAVTVESGAGINGTDGTATLWSASLDALAAGTDVVVTHDQLDLLGPPNPALSRLILVSAGNVRDHRPADIIDASGAIDHLSLCDTSRIEDPAQAWNVLTVGAHTELDHVPADSHHDGYLPVARRGLLSPHSRTSVMFPEVTPAKPDIVMEGGNLLIDADRTWVVGHDAVSLTTTDRTYGGRLLTTMNATSPATAQAARLAALAHARYPELRPEAVRALLVHEAEWTDAMLNGVYNRNGRRKIGTGQLARTLLRRYGWGVPTKDRVLASTASAVTLIVQDMLTPFRRERKTVRLGELKLHELPWPREQLLDLDAAEVQLRVTLSYFIEPNPGRRGMLGQHTYASHRLRFALKGPNESVAAFEHRIAENAQAEDDSRTTGRPFDTDKDWLIGKDNRDRGSLHSDIWRGTGRELADCGVLAVFPAGGWWKFHNTTDRVGRPVSYALLISLKTPEVTADLYTPTAIQLGLPVPVEISTAKTGIPVDMRLF